MMPWQRLVADVGLEVDSNGVPYYREVVVTVPRQSGKTTLMLAWSLYRCLAWPRGRMQRVVYTAQTGQDARMKLIRDQWPILEASPLVGTVKRHLEGAQESAIHFKNGSRIDVQATTTGAGHGRTVDMGIIDEAFDDVDDRREGAMLPAMLTRSDAQLFVVSTAGTDDSVYLRQKVDTGRAMVTAGERTGIAYFEWSAGDDADADDEDAWWSCNPSLGWTQGIDAIRHARKTTSDGLFRRTILNQWTSSEDRVIPLSTWDAACDPDASPSNPVVLAVDAHPERTSAAIAAAGGGVVELVEHRAGLGWVVARVAELADRWDAPVAVDQAGPAGPFIPDLERLGVRVVPLSGPDMAKATGAFYDAVADRTVKLRRNPSLDAAAAGATKRQVGDAWVWARKHLSADVCPLVAVTAARWLAETSDGPSKYEEHGLVVL